MKNRWWRAVAALTHWMAGAIGPAAQLGGRLHAKLFALSVGRLGRKFFGSIGRYETFTDRPLPVVVLEPAP